MAVSSLGHTYPERPHWKHGNSDSASHSPCHLACQQGCNGDDDSACLADISALRGRRTPPSALLRMPKPPPDPSQLCTPPRRRHTPLLSTAHRTEHHDAVAIQGRCTAPSCAGPGSGQDRSLPACTHAWPPTAQAYCAGVMPVSASSFSSSRSSAVLPGAAALVGAAGMSRSASAAAGSGAPGTLV